jgi:broad-specificity NMP kinase
MLTGAPNTGKTTTLNRLYDTITDNGSKNVLACKSGLGNPASNDFKYEVSYKGKRVAIYTMGDYYKAFIEAIIEFANCDVLVLAYNNNFAANLDKFIGRFQHHRVIQKTDSDENDLAAILSEI